MKVSIRLTMDAQYDVPDNTESILDTVDELCRCLENIIEHATNEGMFTQDTEATLAARYWETVWTDWDPAV
jgi:hypothetical protein